MSTPVGIIKKFVDTLTKTTKTGEDALDEAFKSVGAVSYSVFLENFLNDQSGLSEQDFSEQVCGIRLNNKDTGAITGSDAGGKVIKTAESIVPETAKAKELTNAEYNSFTKNGLKFNVTYHTKDDVSVGENFNYSGETYLAKQKLVTRALYNWWIPESLDLINESLGINLTDNRAGIKEINIKFMDSDRYYGDGERFYEAFANNEYGSGIYFGEDCAIGIDFDYDLGLASEITLYINSDLLYNMTADDKNGTLNENKDIISDLYSKPHDSYEKRTFTNYLDRLILQAMAEITLKANVPYVQYLNREIRCGLVEIVGGYDDFSPAYGNFIHAYWDSTNDSAPAGYGRLRYLAKKYSDGVPDGLSYDSNKTVLTAMTSFTESTIDLADFESTVKNVNASALKKAGYIIGNDLANSIVSSSGNDTLRGSGGADTLSGGAGKDSLWGGAGNDTLWGSNGTDTFIYQAGGGTDEIMDYDDGELLRILTKDGKSNATFSKSTFDDDTLTLTINGGGTVIFNNIDDETEFNINGTSYEVSGSKLVKS